MALKSIVDVEVNDEQFRAYEEKFKAYEKALARTGSTWAKIGNETKGVDATFASIVAATVAQVELLREATTEQEDGANAASRSETIYSRISRSTKSIADNVGKTTSFLLKWTALGSIFSGLVGVGGLFGIDRLAGGVSAGRRAALGTGTTYGEQIAFGSSFGRFVEPNSFLSSVNEALHDVTKRVGLYGAGLTEHDIAGKDTAQVAAMLLPLLKNLADRTPANQLAQVLGAFHADQFLSLEGFERLRNTSKGEVAAQGGLFNKNATAFDLSPAQQRSWSDFKTQLENAGNAIERIFVVGLSPLAGPLKNLSASVTSVIGAFFKAAQEQHWVEALGGVIDDFAKYVGDGKFQKDVRTFVEDVGTLARSVHDAIQWLGNTVDNKPGPNNPYSNVHGSDYPNTTAGWVGWVADRARAGGLGSAPSAPPGKPPAILGVSGINEREIKEVIRRYGVEGAMMLPFKEENNATLVGEYVRHHFSSTKPGEVVPTGDAMVDKLIRAFLTGSKDTRTGGRDARVVIHDNTGGNVVISASQLTPPHNPAIQ